MLLPVDYLVAHNRKCIPPVTINQYTYIFLGGPGNRMLNPEVLKCHEDLITLDT